MDTKPYLFLDVDGVLNCLQLNASDCDYVMAGKLPVMIPFGTKERLKTLSENFEIVWCTAWFGNAHPSFRQHLELPDESWPYVAWNEYKLIDILKYAKGRPWVWVDDDIHFELRHLGWSLDTHIPDNARLQEIDPNVGLSDTDVEQLLEWKNSLS